MKSLVARCVLILVVGALLLPQMGLAGNSDGKMPITTSSEKALEYFLQGRDLFEKLQIQESQQYFRKAVAEDPDFALGYLQLSFSVPSAKEFFENLDKAVALVDRVSQGERLWILGVQAGTNAFPLKQREYYQELVKMYPNAERAHNLLATNYFGQQDYKKAIAEYTKASEIAPDFSQPYNQLGYAHRFLKQSC
jgi:tetratricopeptide (TPR) repeat protein